MSGLALDIDDREIVDWYDGVVRAFIHSCDDRGWLYCFLLSYDISSNERTVAYLSMPDHLGSTFLSWLRKLRGGSDFSWTASLEFEASILQASCDPVLVACVRERQSTATVWASCSMEVIRPFFGQGIEGAIARASVEFWSSFWKDRMNRGDHS